MFNFTSKFLHSTKSQRKKLYSMNLVNFVLMLLLLSVSVLPIGLVFNLWAMAFFTGQGNSTALILMTIGSLLFIALIFLMITFPLFTGSVRSIYHAVSKHEPVNWKDLFSTFKGKIWRKSLLVGLTTVLFMFLLFIVDYFITMGLRNAFMSLATNDTAMIMLSFVISVISSLYIWLMAVFLINMIITFIKHPEDKIRTYLKTSWRTIRNGQKTFFTFYIGILLINLVLLIVAGPVLNLVQMNLAHMSQNAAQIILWVVNVIFFIIRYTVYFLMIGTITTYYHQQGRKNA
ncbi:hypothetical protein [Staphylococcus americanisciuri]|uniref:Lytic regulatory protein n=1 Tax=Staphylococcus americanisciuri TaxID=2973940 RepID=A0ABT2F3D6_9STAP|nr:hypothetical protein [Staphylococcus americanisciuri]MCS4486994.1 hypothetical protein [Staphylococcus americanisciuri]